MAVLADGAATGMYAGKGAKEGVCPGVRRDDAKASPAQQGANGAERHCHARRDLRPPPATTLGLAQRERGGVQQLIRPMPVNNQDLEAIRQPCFRSSGWSCIGSDETDKRYRHHQPASTSQQGGAFRYLSLRIQTIQSCISARNPITTTGATLIRARMCVHVFLHRICTLAGPMERAPV